MHKIDRSTTFKREGKDQHLPTLGADQIPVLMTLENGQVTVTATLNPPLRLMPIKIKPLYALVNVERFQGCFQAERKNDPLDQSDFTI